MPKAASQPGPKGGKRGQVKKISKPEIGLSEDEISRLENDRKAVLRELNGEVGASSAGSELFSMMKKEKKAPAEKTKGGFLAGKKDDVIRLDEPAEDIRPRSFNTYRAIAYFFLFLVAVLLIAIFYFSFSKVKVSIVPALERISGNLAFEVYDSSSGSPSGDKQSLAGIMRKIEVSISESYPSSGEKTLSEEVIGRVTIVNNYTKNQPLVATTRLLAPDGKLFRLEKTVNVPAGGSIVADIYADKPGEDMIIQATKFTIPGLREGLQSQIYAESSEATKYERRVKKYILQADIDAAIDKVKTDLFAEAQKQAEAEFSAYDKIYAKLDDNSATRKVEGKVGEEANEVKVEMSADVIVAGFRGSEALALVKSKFNSLIPSDKELVSFETDKVEYNDESDDLNVGRSKFSASFDGLVSLKNGLGLIDPKNLVGLTKSQLEDYLGSLPEIAGYEIKFYPSFVRRVPKLADRIVVEIKK